MLNDDDCGNVSDGDHTFAVRYHHRAILTAALFDLNREIAWRSRLHDDGAMYDEYFIVGIDTPYGQATYHYPLEYWGLFNIKELDRAPKWDGHTSEETIDRIAKVFCEPWSKCAKGKTDAYSQNPSIRKQTA